MSIKKAIFPVAGLGTRFLPVTKAQPKEMLPIVDKPAIQYVVEEAVHSGIEDFLFITGKDKRPLEDYFDHSGELEYHLSNRENRVLELVRNMRLHVPNTLREAEEAPCWGMQCGAPSSISATSILQCCWATTSWPPTNLA